MRELSGSLHAALENGIQLLSRNPVAALEQATAILEKAPGQPDALALLGKALRKLGQPERAAKAEIGAINASLRSPEMVSARLAMARHDLAAAEDAARTILKRSPNDVAAMMLLADIASTLGIYDEAEKLLGRASTLAPDSADVAINLADAIFAQGRIADAFAKLDAVLATDPTLIGAGVSKADMLAQTGRYDAALAILSDLLEAHRDRADIWLRHGHLLKTIGRQDDAIGAYREATAIDPDFAEAWWSLSELKANKVGTGDIHHMENLLRRTVAPRDLVHLHFALGKAFEDQKEWAESFGHYQKANAARLTLDPHDGRSVSREVDKSITLFDAAFFAEHAGLGSPQPDPIFIVGMPRAGSTLIEQILASHSQIEGTAELPDIPFIVRSLITKNWQDKSAEYPGVVERLSSLEIRALGEAYITGSASKRNMARPYFIDKLPNNWRYIGLIRLILPNAKIIDARRDAMSCCFSNFRQHFSQGQTFAYSPTDLGRYYRDYIRTMDHFDHVLPGTIHRVQHETLIDQPEPEIRALLKYLNVPFEEQCLRPHENARPVRTASSEQVRRPMNRDAFDLWRNYEPWLDELKSALGDAWSDAQR